MAEHGPEPGIAYDHAALSRTERRFWRDTLRSAAPEAAAEHRVEVRDFGPIQASAVGDLPDVPMINLVLGADVEGAVERGDLADAIEWLESRKVRYYVPVVPGTAGADAAEAWLAEEGFERGYGWMKFVRDASPPDLPPTPGLELVAVGTGEGGDFGTIVAEGFDLPHWAAALFENLPGRMGWRCYVALVDGKPDAAAAMLIDDGVAEFGLAATLESARGRGCQTALLRRRILDAADAGCHLLFVETGERLPDRPSASYRNILRAGFEEAYVRPNWQRPRN